MSVPEPVPTPEQLASMTNATRQAMETAAILRPTFATLGAALIRAGEKIDAYLWEPYRQAGCPYGTNYRGRDRWYVEHHELDRARTAAAEMQEWTDALANVRRIIAEKGVPVDG